MNELKELLKKKATKLYNSYIVEGMNGENEYKGMGIAYIKFAKEHSNLFKLLFMSSENNLVNYALEDDSFERAVKVIKSRTNLIEKDIVSFHTEIWIFTHGIASLIATNSMHFTDEQINNMLVNVYQGLVKVYNNKKEGENL